SPAQTGPAQAALPGPGTAARDPRPPTPAPSAGASPARAQGCSPGGTGASGGSELVWRRSPAGTETREPRWEMPRGRSPVWMRRCWMRWALWRKLSPQSAQGRSPVWKRRCCMRWELTGFSPVCTRWCRVSAELTLKLFPQWPHSKGFSPVCTRWCCTSCELPAKLFPHSAHL
uniref:Uncharacterized protein n=1 Tax=Nothoprocta perdicaria TaxID=30464 RepID=A0A8C6ZHR1_NOTPE